jgi:aspartyl-tRNA(Asn)/glutamyl-tRNA(Gln) amidotransferase subunit A
VRGLLGTDTGGSIRQPAAFCGVVGLKPTYGRVSRQGVIAYASSLDQVGPMARTVADAALLLEVIAGHDPLDATSLDPARAAPPSAPRGRACASASRASTSGGLDPSVRAPSAPRRRPARRRRHARRRLAAPHPLRAAGLLPHRPAEASSNLARYDGVRYGHRASRRRLARQLYAQTAREGFGPEVKRRIMLGTFASASGYYDAYYRKAQQVRALIKRDFDAAFAQCDVLLTPDHADRDRRSRSARRPATPLEMYLGDVFTLACNLAGLPGHQRAVRG